MKNILRIIFLVFLIIISGCEKSFIKLIVLQDDNAIPMFGKTPSREFYIPVTISDSLKLIWENEAHGSFTNSSAVIYDSTIFISDLSGRIHCFDLQTGKQKGVLKTKGAIYSAPLIFRNKLVYVLCNNKEDYSELIYYDLYNANELFDIIIDGRVLNQMIIDGKDIIFFTENGIVKKYSLAGGEIWTQKLSSKIYCNPALYENKIVVGNDKGEILIFNSTNGDLLLRKKIGKAFYSGVTIYNSIAYIGDDTGILYAINIGDGKIIWQYNTGSRILMNPALDDQNIFIGNLKGELFSLKQIDGKLNWTANFGGLFNSTPLITNNRIIITDLYKSFLLIDKNNGELKKKFELDGRGKLTPILFDNKIIVGYDDGVIRAYEIIY